MINLIVIAIISNLVASVSVPIQDIKEKLHLGIDTQSYFGKMLNCETCLGFWLGLLWTAGELGNSWNQISDPINGVWVVISGGCLCALFSATLGRWFFRV